MRSLIGSIVDRTPVPLTSRRTPGASSSGLGRLFHRDDRTRQLDAMGSVGTLFSIVNRTSTATAKLNWRLWVKASSGRDEDRVEVTSHAALDRWNHPNNFFDRAGFVESVQQHIDLTGEGWPLIAYDKRVRLPIELWFARPDRMRPVCSPTEYIIGYVYTDPDGVEVPLALDEADLIKMPNPGDPYRGMGPVQALLVDLDSVKYSAEWNRNFFINSAEPGGIIEVEKRLSDDDFDEMRVRWAEQHKGVANAHRVGIIEQGKWVNRTFTMRDMQFAELRNVSREIIREAYGIASFMTGLDNVPNRATADTALTMFDMWLTVPRADRWKGWLNNDFLPRYGSTTRGLEFDYDNPVGEDREAVNAERDSKANSARALVEAGYDGTSVAQALELPEELIWVKPAPVPAQLGGQPAPEDGAAAADDPSVPVDAWGALVDRLTTPARGHLEFFDLDTPPADVQPASEQLLNDDELPDISHVAASTDAAIAALLAHWATISDAQKAELLAQIEDSAAHGNLSDLTGLVVDTDAATSALVAAMTALAAIAARQVVEEAAAQGVSIHPAQPRSSELGATAAVTTALLASELKTTAARAALRANGPSVPAARVVDAVRGALADLSPASAATQLGGALHGTVNATRVVTLLAADPVGDIYAHEMNDRNTCRPCGAIAGQLIGHTNDLTAVEKLYPAGLFGGYVDCEGGPRCRGTVVAVWHGDKPPAQPGFEQALPAVPRAGQPFQRSTEGIADLVRTVREAKRDSTQWTKLAGGQASETRFGVTANGNQVVHKRPPSWGDAADSKHQADAEQLTALMARKLGARTAGVYRDSVDSVWMQYVKGKTTGELEDERGRAFAAEQEARIASMGGKRLGLLDVLSGNLDRNPGNMIVDSRGQLIGIDHGSAWVQHVLGEAPGLRGVASGRAGEPIWNFVQNGQWIDNPLTSGDVETLRGRLEDLRPDFEHVGRGDWLDWSLGMLDQLAPHATGKRSML